MEKLLPYYERELSMLRRAGAEFAGRYPKLAGSLQLRGESCADPHVERLIQASAFLNARVAKLLDDGYANFTEALLGMLYPHYLRPMPSCSIARIDYSGARANEISAVNVLPRGTAMKSLGQGTVTCRFRTVYDATVAPVAISAAWFEPYIQTPASLSLPQDAGSAICITIESMAAARSLASLGLSTLRVFIDGEASLCAALRDALFMRTACACVEADGQWRMLDRLPLAPVGFAEEEALLPCAPAEQSAYRLLSEYFTFSEKFDFFDIDLAACALEDSTRFTLRLALSDVRPDAPAARILRALTAANLVLGCTPVVNLFPHPATPIRITHTSSSYPLMPDEMPGSACDIYSIDSVQLVRKARDGSTVTEFFPYYSLRHGVNGESDERKGRYWLAHRDELMTAGLEHTLALVDRDFSPLRMESGTAAVRLTCTNRNLPHGLPYGRANGDLSTESAIGSFPIRMLRRPTLSYRSSADNWGLIAHLALNHRSLTQEGLPALTAMLRLHAQQDSAVSQRMIDGVTALSHRPSTAWIRQAQGNAYLRGIEVQVSLDEEAYAGTGIHAFVQMLDHLFGLHVHLNSFTRLVVLSHLSGKELMRCPPRNGTLTLA